MLAWRAARPAGTPTPRRVAQTLTRAGRWVAPLLLVLAITLPLYAGRYVLDLGVLVLTYVMLGWGLNIVVGLAGLLDLGYVAFYAVGAYSFAHPGHQLRAWLLDLPAAGGTFCGDAGA